MPPSGVVTVPAQSGIIFQARINGKGPYQVMVDTGSVNVLGSAFAKQLGLRMDSSGLKFAAGGGIIDTQTTHVDTLANWRSRGARSNLLCHHLTDHRWR